MVAPVPGVARQVRGCGGGGGVGGWLYLVVVVLGRERGVGGRGEVSQVGAGRWGPYSGQQVETLMGSWGGSLPASCSPSSPCPCSGLLGLEEGRRSEPPCSFLHAMGVRDSHSPVRAAPLLCLSANPRFVGVGCTWLQPVAEEGPTPLLGPSDPPQAVLLGSAVAGPPVLSPPGQRHACGQCPRATPRQTSWSKGQQLHGSLLEHGAFEGAQGGQGGCSAASRVQTELHQASPPSSWPLTSAQWAHCLPAASTARVTAVWAGTLSFLIFFPPPSPEGLFSGRLSS